MKYRFGFWLGMTLCFSLWAAELADFGVAKTWMHQAEERGQSSVRTADGGTVLRWDGQRAGYAELFLAEPVPVPGKGEGIFRLKYRNLPEPAALRAVNLRLRDQKGEMFQWKQRPGEKNGALSFDVSADNFSDCWGGNGRPELPLEVAGLGFDFAAGSGVGAIEPGRLTFEAGRHLRFPAREVWRSFGEDELWQLQAYRGRVHAVEEADSLTVAAAAEIVILRDRGLQLETFGRPREMRFRVRLDSGEAQFAPELRDSTGKVRLLPKQRLKQGENELRFPLREALREFSGLVSVECLKLFLPSRQARVTLEQAELSRELTPAEAVRFRVETGNGVRVLKLGEERALAVTFTNTLTDRPVELAAGLEIMDYHGRCKVLEKTLRLLPGERRCLPLDWKPERFGWHRIRCTLSDRSVPEEKRQVSNSFAYLKPAGPTPGRAEGFLFGVCSHPERWGKRVRELEAEAAGLCGAKVMRNDTEWNLIQPEPGIWNYSLFDHIVEAFGKRGIELNAILAYSPLWARDREQFPRQDAWRNFVRRTVERYRDRIRFWEVWNEPDLPGFAPFGSDRYVEMLKNAYTEIKLAAPEAVVLTGGFATSVTLPQMLADPDRQKRILAEGRGSYQVHAFHGHGDFPYFAQLVDLNLLPMRRKLGVTEPWYANETALTSTEGGERKQAEALFKKLLYAWSRGSIGYNWYDLRDDGYSKTDGEHNYGMLTHDFQPKPVYAVYNMLAGTFSGAEFLRQEQVVGAKNLWLFTFRSGNTLLLPGWSENSGYGCRPVAVRTDARRAERIDLMGNIEPLPLVNGLLLFEIGPEPATLRLIEAHKSEIAGCPVQLAGGGLAVPGREYPVTVLLENPLGTAADFEVALTAPAGLEFQGETLRRFRLEAGEKRRWNCVAVTGRTFRAAGQEPAVIRLRYAVSGTPWKGEESLTVRAAVAIPAADRPDRKPDFRLDRVGQVQSFFRNDPAMSHLVWKGPEDLSAEIRLAADAEALELSVAVRDDIHVQPFRGAAVWQGDNVQIGLAFPNQRGFWEIGLSRLEDGTSEVFVWRAAYGFAPAVVAKQFRLIAERKGTVTTYQAKLPFRALGITSETAQSGFRFNLVVNDNDGGGRESFMRIASGLAEYKQPELFPYVMVVE